MAYYSKETVDKINAEVPIADLMERLGIDVKFSRGKSDFFLCPECGGDWGNSRINTLDNYYKCFKCAAEGRLFQGKPVNLVQYKLEYNFVEAIEYLANEFNIVIQDERQIEKGQQSLYQDVAAFFSTFISQTDYFQYRGISNSVIKKTRCGFAPGAVLKKHLLAKGYKLEQLKAEGLINSKGMDAWFNRIVLPIYRNGKIIDFYTRRADQEDYLKHLYLNGGANILYGHDEINPGVEYLDYYEGLLNRLVVMSNGLQAGISIGSCLNYSNAHVLFAKKIVPKKGVRIIFDADEKGQGQTQAFAFGQLLQKEGVPTWVVMLPLGHDPASMLTSEGGIEKYTEALSKAVPFEEYKAHFLLKDIDVAYILDHLKRRFVHCSNSTSTFSSLYS